MMPYAQPILTEGEGWRYADHSFDNFGEGVQQDRFESVLRRQENRGRCAGTIYCRRKSGENTCFRRRSTADFIQLVLSVHRVGKPVTMDNNLTLFTNAISTMAGESEIFPSRPNQWRPPTTDRSYGICCRYGILLMGILPIGLLAAGIIIWQEGERDK